MSSETHRKLDEAAARTNVILHHDRIDIAYAAQHDQPDVKPNGYYGSEYRSGRFAPSNPNYAGEYEGLMRQFKETGNVVYREEALNLLRATRSQERDNPVLTARIMQIRKGDPDYQEAIVQSERTRDQTIALLESIRNGKETPEWNSSWTAEQLDELLKKKLGEQGS